MTNEEKKLILGALWLLSSIEDTYGYTTAIDKWVKDCSRIMTGGYDNLTKGENHE